MTALVQQDAPWIFGTSPEFAGAYQQWLYNGKPSNIVRDNLQYLRIDPALRVRRIAEWNQPVWWPLPALAALPLLGFLVAWAAWWRRQNATALDHRQSRVSPR